MTTRRQWRQWKRLAERGRKLASQREDLIAAGVDPDELPIPLYPLSPNDPPPRPDREQYRQLSVVWAIVAVACLGAFAGCVSATGAMLVVNNDLTWHAWVSAAGGLGWFVGMVASAAAAGRMHARAREATSA